MKTFEVIFPYDVLYDGGFTFSEMIKVKLSEKDILAAADKFRKNGGFPVELCALESIVEKVEEEIYTGDLYTHFEDDCDYELISVELAPQIPQELVDAVEQYLDTKDVTLACYSEKDGKEEQRMERVTISKDAFNTMHGIVELGRNDKTDFGLLKELFPDIYEQVKALSPAGSELREFPFEIYDTF